MTTVARCLAILAAAILLVACTSVQVVRQGNEVAEAGKVYTVTMGSLSGYVLDKKVEERYGMLVGYRRGTGDANSLTERLETTTTDTVSYAKQIGLFRQHTHKLGAYFDALNVLIDANVKDAGAESTKEAVQGLTALGKALESSLHVTTAQIDAASALGGIVFTELHGARVKAVFERDGARVARQIAIQRAALDQFADLLKNLDKKARGDTYSRLASAFTKDADKGVNRPGLDSGFQGTWSSYVKEPALAEQLATATKAAERMQAAWRDFLAGKEDASDLLAESGRLLAIAEQAKALHENRHKPATN